jgi:hypothetical protein
MADVEYPKFIMLMRGTPSPSIPGRFGVEPKAFFSLDDFKQYAEKENLAADTRFLGVWELGEPIAGISTTVKVVEVEKREWTIPS